MDWNYLIRNIGQLEVICLLEMVPITQLTAFVFTEHIDQSAAINIVYDDLLY